MFSEILLDHFQNPRNAGALAEPTACVEVSNPVCGDVLQLAVKIDANRIHDVKFLCRGCTASIACASAATEIMRGSPVSSLKAITAQSLSGSLGGLPDASFHAAQLAEDAVKAMLAAVAKASPSPTSE